MSRTPSDRALRVVAFGGGTGLPILLDGLRGCQTLAVTAVVTVADDGGSSGRLREELAIAPPGDLRSCLVALAENRPLAAIFAHRFASSGELDGHVLGNFILAALTTQCGDLALSVELAARLLRTRGTVFPAAQEGLTLVLRSADGTTFAGESSVTHHTGALAAVQAAPPGAAVPPGVVAAIRAADLVVLSAGSLFTSTLASLLGGGTRDALSRFGGPVVYVANLQTEPGETDGFSVVDHVRAIAAHGAPRVTHVVVPTGPTYIPIDAPALARLGVCLVRVPGLIRVVGDVPRHDPQRLADAVLALAESAPRYGHGAANGSTRPLPVAAE